MPPEVKLPEPDCWAILTPNGSKLVSPDEAKGAPWAYALFTREAFTAYASARVAQERERCAAMADSWSRADAVKLACGEMTAQELRTAQAVARGIAAAIRKGAT